jgi:hypothetical protein
VYHLQSDGQTEIKNQWQEAYLGPCINYRQSDWVGWLNLAEFADNNTRSKATGKSLFEIVLWVFTRDFSVTRTHSITRSR